jgi:ABC-type enterochelin transport system substrate-binding protein
MITLNTLKITTLAVVTALSLHACKSTSSTQQTAESRVSIADGNARAEAYFE